MDRQTNVGGPVRDRGWWARTAVYLFTLVAQQVASGFEGQPWTIVAGVVTVVLCGVAVFLRDRFPWLLASLGLALGADARAGSVRAIGMTRGQLRGLVVRESVLISVLGGGTGLLAGVGAGVLLQTTMRDQLVALAIPWTTIGVVGVLIVLIGVIAALAPAIRASRTPVLVAIAA